MSFVVRGSKTASSKQENRKAAHATPPTRAKSYRAPQSVIDAIKALAPEYGSRGRALQVATELLIRHRAKIRVPASLQGQADAVATYKLIPRTIELIEHLTETYGRYGDVLAACVQILRSE